VLIFHRVLPEVDPIFPEEVDAAHFDSICGWVRRWFNVLPLDRAVALRREGALPPRALSISFDDGYADNHDVALPILRRHGLSATFFVATDYLDGGRMWNDSLIEAVRLTRRETFDFDGLPGASVPVQPLCTPAHRRAVANALIGRVKYLEPMQRQAVVQQVAERAGADLPRDLMMTSQKVVCLRKQGMVVGAHTASHPILARLPRDEARGEIQRGRDRLESLLQERVALFAYPNGKPGADYVDDSVALVREAGFDAAFSTAWGAAGPASDVYQLPRFTPWDRSRIRFGLRLLHNLASRRA
jgi:peptidoglycan/xylan/chitin deacetylase (PgdA/CDA1 family)